MQNEVPNKIRGVEEPAYFLRAILLLIQNQSQYISAFYGPQARISRSFLGFLWCLPAQLFMLSLTWREHFSSGSENEVPRSELLLSVGIVDAIAWMVVVIAISIIVLASSKKQALFPAIIATNWFNLFATYVFFIPATLSYFFAGSNNLLILMDIIIFITLMWLYFRVIRQIVHNDKVLAFAIMLAYLVISLAVGQIAFASLNA